MGCGLAAWLLLLLLPGPSKPGGSGCGLAQGLWRGWSPTPRGRASSGRRGLQSCLKTVIPRVTSLFNSPCPPASSLTQAHHASSYTRRFPERTPLAHQRAQYNQRAQPPSARGRRPGLHLPSRAARRHDPGHGPCRPGADAMTTRLATLCLPRLPHPPPDWSPPRHAQCCHWLVGQRRRCDWVAVPPGDCACGGACPP